MIDHYYANGKYVMARNWSGPGPDSRIVAQFETHEMAEHIAFLLNWYDKVTDLSQNGAELNTIFKRLEDIKRELEIV